ncbi:hypothetical protein EDB95_4797 [Dinghuibacter silviterrae]|uniref:Uncharacterized protein n=1 Tax=Dinghuibacter silviterrae TaxID=1539049 RepID=A0A4R8DGZ3_9BACT|nr:hypothetical protein EDB95_4797 [Dinghuibacter silviterrae]
MLRLAPFTGIQFSYKAMTEVSVTLKTFGDAFIKRRAEDLLVVR